MATSARNHIVINLTTQAQGFNIDSGLRQNGKLIFNNFTPYKLMFQFQDGSTFIVYPGQSNWLPVTQSEANFTCNFIQVISGTPSNTFFFIDVYDDTADLSGYVFPSQASAFIGGGTVGTVNQIINDGNPAQQVIETTIAGNGSGLSNFVLNNDGTFADATLSYNTYQTVLQLSSNNGAFPAELALTRCFLFFDDTNSGAGQGQNYIFVSVPDNTQKQIHFSSRSNTKEVIDWSRDTGLNYAMQIIREAVNGFTALDLMHVDTSGNVQNAGSLQIDSASGHSTPINHIKFGNATSDGAGNAIITHNFGVAPLSNVAMANAGTIGITASSTTTATFHTSNINQPFSYILLA